MNGEGPKIEIEKIIGPKGEVNSDPDQKTQRELDDLNKQRLIAELEGLRQDITERKAYADKIFKLICWWLVVLATILVAQGFGSFNHIFSLPDAVLVTLVGTTTVSILGIFVVVANYLFYRSK